MKEDDEIRLVWTDAGNGTWGRCSRCGKFVRLKRWLGLLHFCAEAKNGK